MLLDPASGGGAVTSGAGPVEAARGSLVAFGASAQLEEAELETQPAEAILPRRGGHQHRVDQRLPCLLTDLLAGRLT
jgi:hypothetical protein